MRSSLFHRKSDGPVRGPETKQADASDHESMYAPSDVWPSGLIQLHPDPNLNHSNAPEPEIDIVAIHGLGGHREHSWTARETRNMWLDDWLHDDVPTSRILSYGYDTRVMTFGQHSTLNIYQHALELVKSLIRMRENCQRRPIIFIAHSLGGIVLKNALVQCNMATFDDNYEHRWIKLCTAGILFIGTPHLGVDTDFTKMMERIAKISLIGRTSIIKHLRRNSEHLWQLSQQYTPIQADFETVFFFEEYKTPVGIGDKLIVPGAHAAITGARNAQTVVLHKNHHTMVKFNLKSDGDYQSILYYIRDMVRKAPAKVQKNIWQEEAIERARIGQT